MTVNSNGAIVPHPNAINGIDFVIEEIDVGHILIDLKTDIARNATDEEVIMWNMMKAPNSKPILMGIVKTVVVISIVGIAFAEYLRVDTLNSFKKMNPDMEKVNLMMLRDYAMVGNSKTQLTIDQLVDQNQIKSLLEEEKRLHKELYIALQPVNYYLSPMSALLKLNDLSGVTAQKLKVMSLLTNKKEGY